MTLKTLMLWNWNNAPYLRNAEINWMVSPGLFTADSFFLRHTRIGCVRSDAITRPVSDLAEVRFAQVRF